MVAGSNFDMWVDGVKFTFAGSVGNSAPTELLSLAASRVNGINERFANVKLRNVEMFNGASASDSQMANYVYGSGAIASDTLVFSSTDGDGSNDEGVSFSTLGAPVTEACS